MQYNVIHSLYCEELFLYANLKFSNLMLQDLFIKHILSKRITNLYE